MLPPPPGFNPRGCPRPYFDYPPRNHPHYLGEYPDYPGGERDVPPRFRPLPPQPPPFFQMMMTPPPQPHPGYFMPRHAQFQSCPPRLPHPQYSLLPHPLPRPHPQQQPQALPPRLQQQPQVLPPRLQQQAQVLPPRLQQQQQYFGGLLPTPQLQQITAPEPHPSPSPSIGEDGEPLGGVLIYIDNSNIYINTMEHSAVKWKFLNDIKQDRRVRVNIKKLITKSADNRPIIRCVLYGSEPPPVKEFWDNVEGNKLCKVEIQVTKRSTYNNKEREVDQTINLDIGEDIVIRREHTKYGGKLILFTGDGGMISAVKRAQMYNWNVEVWSYQRSLAKEFVEEAKNSDKFKVQLLDEYFEDLVFYALDWKNLVPPERAFVVTFTKLHEKRQKEVMKMFIEAATKLFKLPIAGRFMHAKDCAKKMFTHLALVCSVSASPAFKFDTTTNTFVPNNANAAKANHLHSSSSPGQPNNCSFSKSFCQSKSGVAEAKPNKSTLEFSDSQFERVKEVFYEYASYFINNYDDDDNYGPQLLLDMKLDLEAVFSESARAQNSICPFTKEIIKYDFNNDVYKKAVKYFSYDTNANAAVVLPKPVNDKPTNNKQLSAAAFAMNCGTNGDLNEYLRYKVATPPDSPLTFENGKVVTVQDMILRHKTVVRTFPQFLQDLQIQYEDLKLEAPGREDQGGDDNLGFSVVSYSKPRRKSQKYSQPCAYGCRCNKGFKCSFFHNDKECEFFKQQPDANLRPTYKKEECTHYKEGKCKFKGVMSYLCPFSHGIYCKDCKADEGMGHRPEPCSPVVTVTKLGMI